MTEETDRLLRDKTHFTAREVAIAQLCSALRTETGVPMGTVGERAPDVAPFFDEPLGRGYVGRLQHRFREKVLMAGVTMLYGQYHGLFDAEELDEMIQEGGAVAAALHGAEYASLPGDHDAETEAALAAMLREIREASIAARGGECPHCGSDLNDHDHD